ncbi:MAG: glycosyltransferase family 4 protein [Cyanobacteria bacterium SID2]|nr:glycosyltransferase family 4 protein [Cyanobacteria bacterium SID2]MBP0006588.1 glycosyltransferase family 4 protein [Cyanobacteria bacterium SBC]
MPWTEEVFNREYARQFQEKLDRVDVDIVLTSDSNLIAYLDRSNPFAIWTDTPYAGLIDFYPSYQNLCSETQQQLYNLDRLAFQKCRSIFFASDWAANIAIETYQLSPTKVHVVPFGANLDREPDFETIERQIQSRSQTPYKLLFLGVDWVRKGGNIALEVAKALNREGIPTELSIAGCQPITDEPLPDFVNCLGFLDRTKPNDRQLLDRLFAEAHFFILPSQAECYGHVFCEANASGVPCLATRVGGIPTIIRDGVNGKTFSLNASISDYCEFICEALSTLDRYQALAFSSVREYQIRLNWSIAAQQVRDILREQH